MRVSDTHGAGTSWRRVGSWSEFTLESFVSRVESLQPRVASLNGPERVCIDRGNRLVVKLSGQKQPRAVEEAAGTRSRLSRCPHPMSANLQAAGSRHHGPGACTCCKEQRGGRNGGNSRPNHQLSGAWRLVPLDLAWPCAP